MSAVQLAVIIINYKTPDLVLDVLTSLKTELVGGEMKAIIVDNDSQDESVTKIEAWIDNNNEDKLFELIASTDNSGFSGGNNRGLTAIGAEYYLLLNSDTIVRKGAIQELLKTAKAHPEAGLISPRLEWPDALPQESCFNYHSPISELINAAATGPITKLFSKYIIAQPVKSVVDFYQWTSFACVLVRKQVFNDIGLMDAGYFMYYEDVAFSRKAQAAGWKVLNNPNAHVVHLRGGSSPVKQNTKLRKRLPRYFFESRTRYFYEFYGRFGLIAANLLWTVGWLVSKARALLSKNFVAPSSQCQWRDIWTNFFSPMKAYIHPSKYKKS